MSDLIIKVVATTAIIFVILTVVSGVVWITRGWKWAGVGIAVFGSVAGLAWITGIMLAIWG